MPLIWAESGMLVESAKAGRWLYS
ncbi:DUF1493 family protein [Salmonella enterica]